MDILKISANCVKITLTDEELSARGIDIEAFETSGKALLDEILQTLRSEYDFCSSGKITAEIFGYSGGGCEIFLSCQENLSLPAARSGFYRSVWAFDNIEYMLSACNFIKNYGYTGKSSAYHAERKYYLLIEGDTLRNPGTVTVSDFITEYGNELDIRMASYIHEHTFSIELNDAIGILGNLAATSIEKKGFSDHDMGRT